MDKNELNLNPQSEVLEQKFWENDDHTNFLKLARDAYGTSMRKGLDKFAFSHCIDVLDACELEHIDGVARSALIYTSAILHDILEDFPITPERLQIKLSLTDQEINLLKLLSRNYHTDPNSSYIESVMKNDNAAIIKCADRIANIKDLILWVRNERGFTESASFTAKKYIRETNQMLDLLEYNHPDLFTNPDNSPLNFLHVKLKNQLVALNQISKKYNSK